MNIITQAKMKYQWGTIQKEEEGADMYHVGGFHPVHLGQIYHGNYEILRKLGYGQYFTVWLVKDHSNDTYRTLKFWSADSYGSNKAMFERRVLVHLKRKNRWDNRENIWEGYKFITLLIDAFEHQGPNGRHFCFVFEVMGATLATFHKRFTGNQVPTSVMRRFTKQLLLALDYAHELGLIHTNIEPKNIRIKIKNVSKIIEKYLEINPASPAARHPSTPSWMIQSQSLNGWYIGDTFEPNDFDIALGDWSMARLISKYSHDSIQPLPLRSPEVLIGAPWGPSTDLWNLGAIMLEIFCSVRLFRGRVSGKYELKQHLLEIAGMLGPFPRKFLAKGNPVLIREYFDKYGDIKDAPSRCRVPFEVAQCFANLDPEAKEKFVDFLRALMKIDPEERKTAAELLAEPWLAFDKKRTQDRTA